MIKKPRITVLMPVRNGAKYIGEAIDSVLQQTYGDFEFLIIDDGSIDETPEIIKSYIDPRIRFERREAGFVKSLNYGLEIANGEYIARMDADDIMHSERLRLQLKRMELDQRITVLSSWMKLFKTDGAPLSAALNLNSEWIGTPILEMLKSNFVSHPTVMLRKNFLKQYNLFYQNYECVEDYKLWFDIAKHGGIFFVEPRNLLFYRISEDQVSSMKRKVMIEQSVILKREILLYLLNEEKSQNSFVLHSLYNNMQELEKNGFLEIQNVIAFFYEILVKSLR